MLVSANLIPMSVRSLWKSNKLLTYFFSFFEEELFDFLRLFLSENLIGWYFFIASEQTWKLSVQKRVPVPFLELGIKIIHWNILFNIVWNAGRGVLMLSVFQKTPKDRFFGRQETIFSSRVFLKQNSIFIVYFIISCCFLFINFFSFIWYNFSRFVHFFLILFLPFRLTFRRTMATLKWTRIFRATVFEL